MTQPFPLTRPRPRPRHDTRATHDTTRHAGGPVAHGFLTLSLAPFLNAEAIPRLEGTPSIFFFFIIITITIIISGGDNGR
jgi:acyl dehydratase